MTQDDVVRVLSLRRAGAAPARIARVTGLPRAAVREVLRAWRLGPDDVPVEAGAPLPVAADTRGLVTLRDAAAMLSVDEAAVRRMLGSRLLVAVARTEDGRSLVRRSGVVALGAQARGRGERSASARLTARDRELVREAIAAGESPSELARRHGVSRRHIYRIAEAEPWGGLPERDAREPATAEPDSVPLPRRRGPPHRYDHAEAVRLVIDEGVSIAAKARRLGVSPAAVRLALIEAAES